MSGACLALALAAGCREPDPAPAGTAPAPAIAAPIPSPIPLIAGTTVEAELAGGGTHLYRLDLPPGHFADLVIDQRGIDVQVRLTAPEPYPVVDSPNEAWGPEPLPVLGAPGGPIVLEVRGGKDAGRYAVLVKAVRPATQRDRDRVAAERSFAEAEELRRKGGGASLRAAAARAEEIAARFRDLGETGRMADALYAAGKSRWPLGDAEAALRDYQAALTAFRAVGDQRAVGRTLNSLGPIRLALGDPAAALAGYRDSLAIFRTAKDPLGEATSLSNLGRAQATLGQAEEALAAYDQALALWRRLGRNRDAGKTLANRGELLISLGQAERALDDLGQALPLLAGRPEAAGVLASRAYLQSEAGRTAQAEADLRQALALQRRTGDRRGEAVTLNGLGLLRQKQGRVAEARQIFEQVVALFAALGDPPNEAAALTNLGALWADHGEPEAAETAFERAITTLAASGRRTPETTAWTGLAKARRAQGDLQGALRAAETGLARIESLRTEPESQDLRVSFFASQQEAYALAVDLAMDLRDPARALAINERARARGLLDALAAAEARPSVAFAPLTLKEIQTRTLDPDTVLLEYALGERRSFLWAVSADRLNSWELPPRAVLEGAAQRAHTALASPNRTLARSESEDALAALSRLLLAPAAGSLADHPLVVVPDGALHLVPFAALPDPVFQDGPLLARREVVTVPSASSLAGIRKRRQDAKALGVVAVLADPVFGGSNRFPQLPQTREEARRVLSLAPPGERLEALGFAARRELATGGALSRFRVIHFATHAVVDSQNPELSGIALSMVDEAGRPRDGFLRSQEIYRLRLRADLVVLSACETALGREVRGEGVVGLTRAFLHAGARRMLVSLWPVEDSATTELMGRFYQGLFTERLTPAAALRRAQDEARRAPGRNDPYFWAGFVLQGDPR